MNKNKESLSVVVNGQPVEVEVNFNAPLRTLIPKALELTDNTGRPPTDWELRDINGNLLDLDKKIEDHNFPPNVKLFLNLKSGTAGQ
jgi:hypothetical protein